MDRNVEEKFGNTVSINISGMPATVFHEWNTDCIENYGDCRWVKMMSDHKKASQFDSFIEIYSEVLQRNISLEERIINLEKQLDLLKRASVPKEEKITLA